MTDDERREAEALYYLAAQKRAELFESKRVTDLHHPCRETCSGWRQGFEKGRESMRAELENTKQEMWQTHMNTEMRLTKELLQMRAEQESHMAIEAMILKNKKNEIEVERARSAKLIEALREIAGQITRPLPMVGGRASDAEIAKDAIEQYEQAGGQNESDTEET